MGTLLESKEALRSRGLEVSLTLDEVNALINNRVDSLARLAFAACPPGDAPTNEQIDGLFIGQVAPNPGTYASMKRLIFEAQTLLSAELQNKVHKTDEQVKSKLAPAERDNRIKEQRTRLEGLRFKGEEECSHQSYDLVLNMMERDSLVYASGGKTARVVVQIFVIVVCFSGVSGGGWGGGGMLTFIGLAHLRDATLLHVLFILHTYALLRYCIFFSIDTTT